MKAMDQNWPQAKVSASPQLQGAPAELGVGTGLLRWAEAAASPALWRANDDGYASELLNRFIADPTTTPLPDVITCARRIRALHIAPSTKVRQPLLWAAHPHAESFFPCSVASADLADEGRRIELVLGAAAASLQALSLGHEYLLVKGTGCLGPTLPTLANLTCLELAPAARIADLRLLEGHPGGAAARGEVRTVVANSELLRPEHYQRLERLLFVDFAAVSHEAKNGGSGLGALTRSVLAWVSQRGEPDYCAFSAFVPWLYASATLRQLVLDSDDGLVGRNTLVALVCLSLPSLEKLWLSLTAEVDAKDLHWACRAQWPRLRLFDLRGDASDDRHLAPEIAGAVACLARSFATVVDFGFHALAVDGRLFLALGMARSGLLRHLSFDQQFAHLPALQHEPSSHRFGRQNRDGSQLWVCFDREGAENPYYSGGTLIYVEPPGWGGGDGVPYPPLVGVAALNACFSPPFRLLKSFDYRDALFSADFCDALAVRCQDLPHAIGQHFAFFVQRLAAADHGAHLARSRAGN